MKLKLDSQPTRYVPPLRGALEDDAVSVSEGRPVSVGAASSALACPPSPQPVVSSASTPAMTTARPVSLLRGVSAPHSAGSAAAPNHMAIDACRALLPVSYAGTTCGCYSETAIRTPAGTALDTRRWRRPPSAPTPPCDPASMHLAHAATADEPVNPVTADRMSGRKLGHRRPSWADYHRFLGFVPSRPRQRGLEAAEA